MLVDGGAGLNLLSTNVFRRLQIPDSELSPTGTFQGVCPGMTQPLGQITLPVTFGIPSNYRTEQVTFDVADTPLPYNGILGRPALAKFMAASHYAYNVLKMPGPSGVLTVHTDKKDAIYCVEQVLRATSVAQQFDPDEPEAPSLPESRRWRLTEEPALTKQVALRPDGSGLVTIGARLTDK